MTPTTKRWLGRGLKFALTVLILFFLGRQFISDIRQLDFDKLHLRPEWLLLATAFYLIGLFPSAWFWRHLQIRFGYPMSYYAAVRAHYMGQLGKYVPGKALAIAIRSELAHAQGVPYGVSIIATFYEVFTGMAAAAMVAALIFIVDPPRMHERLNLGFDIEWHPAWLGAMLIILCGVPLLPGVFNFLVGKMTAKIQAVELYRIQPLTFGTLALGLSATAAGWWVQGLGWWATLCAVLPAPPEWSFSVWGLCTASIAFATVAGFASMIPGGFVVREVILRVLLTSLGSGEDVLAAAIVLRLNSILAEALFALVTFWLKPGGERREPLGSPEPSPLGNTSA